MVRYLTRVLLRLPPAPALAAGESVDGEELRRMGQQARSRWERAAEMIELLAGAGFRIHAEKDRMVAESTEIEAAEAKALLRSRGFGDREYQMLVEYERRWGLM